MVGCWCNRHVTGMDLERYLDDASGYRGEAERAFTPESIEEVRRIVEKAAAERIPLTISGAGTGLTGARVPRGGWIISLEQFRSIEVDSRRVRCGAGALLKDVQHAAERTRQFFGPNPTEWLASIGGIIATNAGGARSFRYGAVRTHVLALEATFMDGRTVRMERGERVDFPYREIRRPATTKNAAGYYLAPDLEWVDLLTGSEGTLAIVTAAELQLLAQPAAILSGVVFFESDEHVFSAVEDWRKVSELRLLEFMDANALRLLRATYTEIPSRAQAALLVEQNLSCEDDAEVDRWAERLAEQHALDDSWFGLSAADRERFRVFRHALPAALTDVVRRMRHPNLGTDFAVPLAHNRDLYVFYKSRCEQTLPGRYVIYGHIGDANNHVNLLPASPHEARQAEELIREFAEYAVSLGGTVAAEHGIGKIKTGLLPLMYTSNEIEAMREVKCRLDPDWLLGRANIFAAPAA
jgi:FAD/FMN-containing dehydrogenase